MKLIKSLSLALGVFSLPALAEVTHVDSTNSVDYYRRTTVARGPRGGVYYGTRYGGRGRYGGYYGGYRGGYYRPPYYGPRRCPYGYCR